MYERAVRVLGIVPLLIGLAFLILAVAGAAVTVTDVGCSDHPGAILCTVGGD